jgi:hypothetical protein
MGAGAVLINEGYGLQQKLTDLQAVHGLVVPFKPVPKPKPTLTPEQIAERRLTYINTLTTDSPGFNNLSDSEREQVLYRQQTQLSNQSGFNRSSGVVSQGQFGQRTNLQYRPGLVANNG